MEDVFGRLGRDRQPVIQIEFLWLMLGKKVPFALRVYQAFNLLLAIMVAAEPGLRWNLATLFSWELACCVALDANYCR